MMMMLMFRQRFPIATPQKTAQTKHIKINDFDAETLQEVYGLVTGTGEGNQRLHKPMCREVKNCIALHNVLPVFSKNGPQTCQRVAPSRQHGMGTIPIGSPLEICAIDLEMLEFQVFCFSRKRPVSPGHRPWAWAMGEKAQA